MPHPNHDDHPDDRELIRRYAETHSDEAFGLLMDRHLQRVYSVCRRDLGDRELADDATQVVFLLLARKARTLRKVVCLAGWLFRAARLVCRNMRRHQVRLRHYETPLDGAGERSQPAEYALAEPYLLDALDALRPKEQDAVVLRFFEEREFAEIGRLLGISEDAARMRVNRALGRMRSFLTARGIGPDSEEALPATLTPAVFLVPVPTSCQSAVAGLVRTVPLADALAHLPADNTIRLTLEGVIRTMRFQTAHLVAVSLAASGLLTAIFFGTRNLAAASIQPPLVARPRLLAETSPVEPRVVVMKFRLIERLTREDGTTKDNLLNSPIISTINNRPGMLTLSTDRPNGDGQRWIVDAVPLLNADGTISVRLTYRNEEKVSGTSGDGEVEETIKEHKVTSKLRLKPNKFARISLLKGTQSEFVLEVAAVEPKPDESVSNP